MFAVVANGIHTICRTQRLLEYILAVYPYPKFKKCATEEEAREWLRQNVRRYNVMKHMKYGDTASTGYATIEYFIAEDNIYYNVITERLGFIRIMPEKDVKINIKQNLIKIQVCNVKLDNSLIAHHVVAVRRILKLLGSYIDVDIVVPDISIFLALTKYSGRNYVIQGARKDIMERLGAVSFTIK